jgi:hypothetical protein
MQIPPVIAYATASGAATSIWDVPSRRFEDERRVIR